MSELEDLIKQRKELDFKIKELKERGSKYDRAKFFLYHFASQRPDEWRVAVLCQEIQTSGSERWKTIISSPDKDAVLAAIDAVVTSLNGLRDKLIEAKE